LRSNVFKLGVQVIFYSFSTGVIAHFLILMIDLCKVKSPFSLARLNCKNQSARISELVTVAVTAYVVESMFKKKGYVRSSFVVNTICSM
jgi:hypothetical protein